MARPAWTNIASTDIDVDSPGKTDTVFGALNDNTASGRILMYYVDIAEDTSTAGAFEDVNSSTHYVYIPSLGDYTGIARKVLLGVRVKVTSGDTGSYRLYNVTNSTAGDTATSTSATYEDKDLSLTVDDSWKGTVIACKVQFYRSAGTAGSIYIEAPDSGTGRVEY